LGSACRPRFAIQQYRFHESLQITSHSRYVVVEDISDPLDVIGTRIACDQMLDQLPADRGTEIGIMQYIVETVVEIFSGCLAGRQRNTEQQGLSSRIVVCGVRYSHGIDVVGN